MPSDNPLVGTWRLLSWENRDVSGGEVIHPLGEDALGYIMYGQDGRMSVAIARADRAGFAAGDLLGGSAEERAHAAETYVSYCGTYEWRGETVIHEPVPQLGRRRAGAPRGSRGGPVNA